MTEKFAQAGECGGGGARPPPSTLSTITYKVVMYAPAVRADTLPLFQLYPYKFSVVVSYPLGSLRTYKDGHLPSMLSEGGGFGIGKNQSHSAGDRVQSLHAYLTAETVPT
jgi:hypothetical protein